MTLDEEFEDKCEFLAYGTKHSIQDWFKSYILSLTESVKLERKAFDKVVAYKAHEARGYNQALVDQDAKIAKELKRRGI